MSDLGTRQHELLRALVSSGPVPDGFDTAAIAATAAALVRKRCAETERLLPMERAELGDRFCPLFTEWATGRPRTDSQSDAAAFLRHLHASRELARPRPRRLRRLWRAITSHR